MKKTDLIFLFCMGGILGVSVAVTLILPALSGQHDRIIYMVCLMVVMFAIGVMCFTAGQERQTRQMKAEILKSLNREWNEKVHRLPPAHEIAAHMERGRKVDEETVMRRYYAKD